MSKNLSIKYYNLSIKTFKSKILIFGFFKDDKLTEELDNLSNNKLVNAIRIDKFKGEENKNIHVYGNKNILRFLLVGLGEKTEFNGTKAREVGAKLVRKIISLKLDSVAIDFKSFNLNRSKCWIVKSFI